MQRGLANALLAAATVYAYAADPTLPRAASAVLSEQQTENALHPPLTRGFTPRGITRTDATAQSVSLNIQFEHNSSTLQSEAAAQLDQL